MSVQAVVLDIGNVLIEWNPEAFYDARLGPRMRHQFMAETDIHAMNLEVDRGADLHDATTSLALRHPRWADEIKHWHDSWLQFVPSDIPHSVRLMRALQHKGVPVFALSNFGNTTFDMACGIYPFLHDFDRSYISARLGVIKPDAAIYQVLERDSGLAQDALLFTDDRPENIAAAQNRGWRTHLFDGSNGWAQTLIKAGLLSETEAQ
ncbi:MAG: HAD family hydrolase [Roseovarius sp.]